MDWKEQIVAIIGSATTGGIAAAVIQWWRNRGKDAATAYKTRADGNQALESTWQSAIDNMKYVIDQLKQENEQLEKEKKELEAACREKDTIIWRLEKGGQNG